MRKWLIIRFAAAGAVATAVPADITMSVDVLDGVDPGAPTPAGLVIADVHVDVSANDWFVSGGIVGHTLNGATLIYGPNNDPNLPGPTFRPPGLDNRFVTFGSAAYGRNDLPRFAPAGTIAEPTIAVLGVYDGGGPVPRLEPDLVNVAYFAHPRPPSYDDPDAPRGRDGYVMRLAFDVTDVQIPGAEDASNYRIFTPGQSPPDYQPVFVSERFGQWSGTFVGNWFASNDGQDWGLYVPEPHPLGPLLFGALMLLRFRR